MAKTYYLTGEAGMCFLDKPDKFGKFSIQVYLDEHSWKIYDESGMMMQPKLDDDGQYLWFRREPVKHTMKGKVIEFGPPGVFDADGDTMQAPELIGKGSQIIVKVTTYEGGGRVGHILDAVKVKELVERVPFNSDFVASENVDAPF